jgi:hypothetical protein
MMTPMTQGMNIWVALIIMIIIILCGALLIFVVSVLIVDIPDGDFSSIIIDVIIFLFLSGCVIVTVHSMKDITTYTINVDSINSTVSVVDVKQPKGDKILLTDRKLTVRPGEKTYVPITYTVNGKLHDGKILIEHNKAGIMSIGNDGSFNLIESPNSFTGKFL